MIAAETGEFRDLVLRRHHGLCAAAIEPVAQLVRRQQRSRGNNHHPKLYRRKHGLPQRNDVSEQQQKVIAAFQTLGSQEISGLIGAA